MEQSALVEMRTGTAMMQRAATTAILPVEGDHTFAITAHATEKNNKNQVIKWIQKKYIF